MSRVSQFLHAVTSQTALLIGALGMVTMISSMVYLGHSARVRDFEAARQESIRLANIATQNTTLSFLTVDLMLHRAVDRQYFNALFGGNLRSDVEQHFSVWLREEPHLAALLATDAQGNIRVLAQRREHMSTLLLSKDQMFPGREHFERHKDDEATELMISPAQFTRDRSHPYIYLSRRIENIDGSFGGLVVAIMDGYFLTDYFRSVENQRNTQFALILDQSRLLIENSGLEPSLALLQTVRHEAEKLTDHNEEVIVVPHALPTETALFTFAPLRTLPVMVALVMHEDDIYRNARSLQKRMWLFGGIFVLFLSTVVGFSWKLNEQMRHAKRSEEKALAASQAKSDFLAKMSHELRTPLNAIIGFSEMIVAKYFGDLTPKQEERLRDIHTCGLHLLELITDILDFSKGDAGKMTLNEEVVDVPHLIEVSLKMISQRAQEKHIKLIIKGQKTLPNLRADEKRLRQILLNLLSNAVKFTPEQGTITISSYLDPDPEGGMILCVEDTGIGMAPEDIPRALQVFEQVHREGSYEGTGLGLPLAKMFTELHGGKFYVESQKNIGTKISIALPKDRVLS